MHNWTHITEVTQSDWLNSHTLHECSAMAKKLFETIFEFILCLLSFPSGEGWLLDLRSK